MTVWQDRSLGLHSRRDIFSGFGYLVFFLAALNIAILAREAKLVLVLAATLLFTALFHSRALKLLARWQLWCFILVTLVLSPFVIGEKDITLWGVGLSQEGFWAGVWMTLRAFTIALAAGVFAGAVSVSQMAQLFERMRLKGLGFALGVATNVLPTVYETMETSYQAVRLRGGFRRARLRTLRSLLVAIIAGSLRRGDDIVSAAEARAFDPTTSQGPPLRMTRADLVLATIVLLLGLALLVL